MATKYSPLVQRLLRKQKLIVKDRKYAHIKGIEIDNRRISVNNGTADKPHYKETNRTVSSLFGVKNSTVPLLKNGQCMGSWENGLTKKEIEFLADAGIPRIDENTEISYYDNQIFDLTNPVEVAYFNVLMASGVISPSEELLGSRRYYLEFSDKVRLNKNKKKENLRAVLTLEKKLTPVEKRQLLYVVNFSIPINSDIRIDAMSDEDVSDAFSDIVLDDDFIELILKKATGAGKTIETEALLCKAVEKGVFFLDVQERVLQMHGDGNTTVFSDNYDEALKLLSSNMEYRNRIIALTSDTNYQAMSMSDTSDSLLSELYATEDEELDYETIKFEEIQFLEVEEIQSFIKKSKGYEQIKHKLENVVEKDDWVFWGKMAFASRYVKPILFKFFKEHEGIMTANGIKIPKTNSRIMTMYEVYVKVQDAIQKDFEEK
ncbi:MAG: hypothetical protein AB8G11_02400 [Saprospiraceae bacterium]